MRQAIISRFPLWICFPILVAVLAISLGKAYGDDLIDIYRQAVDKDPQLRGASFESLALKESIKQARGRVMPGVSLEGVGTRTYQDIVKTSNPVFAQGVANYDTKLYTAKLVQPIFRYSLFIEISQAKKLSKRADVDLEMAKQDLMIRVAQTYLTTLAAKENIAFAQAEKRDVEVFFERAKARYNSGLAPNTDLYDAEARLASVNSQLVKAENDYRDALQAVMEITGNRVVAVSALKDALPLVSPDPDDPEAWVDAGLQNNLKVKSVGFDVDVAKDEISRQKSAYYPSLDLVGRYYRNDMGGSLFGGGATVDTKDVTLDAQRSYLRRSRNTVEDKGSHQPVREGAPDPGTAETARHPSDQHILQRREDGPEQGERHQEIGGGPDDPPARQGAGLQVRDVRKPCRARRGQRPVPVQKGLCPEQIRIYHKQPEVEAGGRYAFRPGPVCR